jgi:hypothetical protein
MCVVCNCPSDADVCGSCQAVTVRCVAEPHVPESFKGSNRSQVRDRQGAFKHATELLATDASRSDLTSVRDRLPLSRRGKSLRAKIDKRLQAPAFNPFM